MINVYKWAVIDVTEDQWVMLYNDETKEILVEPQQCSGSHTCANTLVVANTKEELEQYIVDNGLVYSLEADIDHGNEYQNSSLL